MSIALFSLADVSVAQVEPTDAGTKKAPPRRTAVALSDRKTVPEPR